MATDEYIPTIWVNGTTPAINATNLNHIENGIKNSTDAINELDLEIGDEPIVRGTWYYETSTKTLHISDVPTVP